MAASVRRCVTFVTVECQRLARDLRIIASILQSPGGGSGLAFNTAAVNEPLQQSEHKDSDPAPSVLDSIFSNVLLAVQRNRRSVERRMTRRMQMAGHFEYAVPRKDIVVDLETGHWKEKGTICKHHYEQVKAETKQMQEELGEAMQYTADQKEVVFLYQGEEEQAATQRDDGRHVVHMKKQRPSWFSDNLLEKS